jgi:hypothetical protein
LENPGNKIVVLPASAFVQGIDPDSAISQIGRR